MNRELTGERIRRRWRKDTLREVYLRPDGTVLKRYWVKPGTRRYPKPWVREHAALRRLAGESVPGSYGYAEDTVECGLEVRFVRDYVAGECLRRIAEQDVPALARSLAYIHGKRVVIEDSMIGNFAWDARGELACIDLGTARCFAFGSQCFYYHVGKELERLSRELGGSDSVKFRRFAELYETLLPVGVAARALRRLGFITAAATRYLRKESAPARILDRWRVARLGDVELRKKRYSGGRLLLRRGPDDVHIEDFVTRLRFLDTAEAEEFPTRNLQHRLFSFALPGAGKKVVMKTFWPQSDYRLGRRINIWLHNLVCGEARRAFFGALKLEHAGIAGVRALAQWTYRRSPFAAEGYLLYEEVQAERTLRDVALRAYGGEDPEARQELASLVDSLAALVATLHSAGLSHDDLATGNFLVAGDNDAVPRLFLLDSERVRTRHVHLPGIKRALDLNDLRRLNLDEALRRKFLRLYMGDAYSENWWKVLEFWRRGGNRPFRTALKWLAGRPDTARKDGS